MNQGHELARALRAAYWAMNRRTNALLAGYRVTADQFVLLSRLADEDGITQKDLAHSANSDANTTRAMLVLLQKRGLVKCRAHASDRRAHCVVMTPKGHHTFATMMRATTQLRRHLLRAVKHGNARTLRKNLHSIARILETVASGDQKSRVNRQYHS